MIEIYSEYWSMFQNKPLHYIIKTTTIVILRVQTHNEYIIHMQ